MNFSQSTVFSIVASFGLLLVNMIISIIEARVLGPEEVGRFQVYITTQNYVATICALGIGQSCIYFINALKVDERKVLATSINFTLIMAATAGVVIGTIILLSPDYFGKDSLLCVCLFCIGTSAILINNIFTPVLLTKMEVVPNQIVKYSTRIITLVVLLFFLLRGRGLCVGTLIGLTGFTGVLSSFLLYYYFRNRFSFKDGIDGPLLGKITLWGIKLSGNNIASITLTSLPIYFMTWFSLGDGRLNVGYYGRANALLVVGTIIASSIGPLLYSKWSGTSDTELKNQVRRMSLLYVFVNFTIALGLIAFAPILIRLLYGNEYSPSIPVLQVLAISLIGNGIKEICYGILSSRGVPLKILKNLAWGILLSAVANYLLIPRYGVLGCATVTTITSFVTAFLLMIDATKVSQIVLQDFFVVPTRQELYKIASQLFHKS